MTKIGMIDVSQLQILLRTEDWEAAHAMLDKARAQAVTRDDMSNETYWRVKTLVRQGRYQDGVDFLRKNASLYNSQCLVKHELADCFIQIGFHDEALNELKQAPFEEEMEDFYGLAIDAKFFYFYLLAKSGDKSIANRLSEIPDDYRYIALGGKFLIKPDIAILLDT